MNAGILSDRYERFSQAVAEGKSHRDAALAAGYPEKTAVCQGSRLWRKAAVKQRIAELRRGEPIAIRRLLIEELRERGAGLFGALTILDEGGKAMGIYIPLDSEMFNGFSKHGGQGLQGS